MKTTTIAAVLACLAFALPVHAAEQTGAGPIMALTLAPAKDGAKLMVSSAAFKNNAVIPDANSQVGPPNDKHDLTGSNLSPPLTWSAGPAGTLSYAMLMEDSNVKGPKPPIHWVVYDIPGKMTSLPQGIASGAKTPFGALQGVNEHEGNNYRGPRPPSGQTRIYHFQIFALDKVLGLDPAKTDRAALLDAMKGHVLASGETIGTFTAKW